MMVIESESEAFLPVTSSRWESRCDDSYIVAYTYRISLSLPLSSSLFA